jgi:histidinol-phosphate aminotransferase
MYQVSAALNDIELIDIPLTPDFQLAIKNITPFLSDKNIKLMFVCSPNNPTGNTLHVADIEFLLQNFQGIVAIDEAYIDFSEQISFSEKINQYPNLLVMQTFSKAMGMAAIRVGMAFSNPVIIQYLNKTKPPYNVSELNQQAAIAQIKNYEKVDNQIVSTKKEREKLSVAFQKFSFIKKIYPSEANFLLIEVTDANALYTYLVEKNIIVRNRNTVVKNCLRITVGNETENKQLIGYLEKYLQTVIL